MALWSESNEGLQSLTNRCLSALLLSANEIVTKFTLRVSENALLKFQTNKYFFANFNINKNSSPIIHYSLHVCLISESYLFLQKVYLSFMLVCKNTSAATMSTVTSMRKQVADMMCLKPKSAQAFIATYLQQMRKCIDSIEKKKVCRW